MKVCLVLGFVLLFSAQAPDERSGGGDADGGSGKPGGLYDSADADEDGVLSESEWQAARGKPGGENWPGFSEADRDGDGVADRSECRAAVGEGATKFPAGEDDFVQWALAHRAELLDLVRDEGWMAKHEHLLKALLEKWDSLIKYPEVVLEVFKEDDFWVDRPWLARKYMTTGNMQAFKSRHAFLARRLGALWLEIYAKIARRERRDERRDDRRGEHKDSQPEPEGAPHPKRRWW